MIKMSYENRIVFYLTSINESILLLYELILLLLSPPPVTAGQIQGLFHSHTLQQQQTPPPAYSYSLIPDGQYVQVNIQNKCST